MIYPLLRYKHLVMKFLITGMLLLVFAASGKSQDLDYRAQSLYIYKFTRFIYWPESNTSGDFIIGVYGNSPIIEELRLMASLKKAGNEQNILVKEVSTDDDLLQYHIIYVSYSKSRQVRAMAEQIGKDPVLIVAEREGMAAKGATISFMVTDYEILKFEVNIRRLEEQKLTISEELVKLGFKL